MDLVTAFNDIVSTVRSNLNSKIISTAEDYRRSARIHDESPTISHIAKRGHAFANIKQLHNEVKFRIEDEITKRVRILGPAPHAIDREEIFWVVMNSQGECGSENACGRAEANSTEIETKQSITAEPSTQIQQAADMRPRTEAAQEDSANVPGDAFSFCPYPGCDWKIKTFRQSQWHTEKHIEKKHLKIRYRCEAGCNKVFTTGICRRTHELKAHSISVYRSYDDEGGFQESQGN